MKIITYVDLSYDSIDEVRTEVFIDDEKAQQRYEELSQVYTVYMTESENLNLPIHEHYYINYSIIDLKEYGRGWENLSYKPENRYEKTIQELENDGYTKCHLVGFYGSSYEECQDLWLDFLKQMPEIRVLEQYVVNANRIEDNIFLFEQYGTKYKLDFSSGKIFKEKIEYYKDGELCTVVGSGTFGLEERRYWKPYYNPPFSG